MMRTFLKSLRSLALATLAAAAAILAVLALLWLLGYPPVYIFKQWLIGAAGESTDFYRSLREACPLLMTGLAAGIAFRCGVFNIGGEGQFLCGSIASVAVATALPNAPPFLVIPASCLAAAAAGGCWALIAAMLDRYRGVPLVLSTILLNVVALYLVKILVTGPLHDPGQGEQSIRVPLRHWLTILEQDSGLHAGIFVALLAAAAAWVIQSRTRFGFELLVTGHNAETAELSGIPIRRRALQVMAISGALAGLGGGLQTLGVDHFVQGEYVGYGYTGIAVALLGRMHPLGILAAAIFFGMLERGAAYVESDQDYPLSHYSADLVKGLILIVMLSANATKIRWPFRPRKANSPAPPAAEAALDR